MLSCRIETIEMIYKNNEKEVEGITHTKLKYEY